jgi:hypothetical protein
MRIGVVVVLGFACGNAKSSEPAAPSGTCAGDSDCIISCDIRGDCCGNPFCESVQHVDIARANAAHNRKECTPAKSADCNDVGGRVRQTYVIVPRCQRGGCIGEKRPIEGSRTPDPSGGGGEVIDTSGYDRTCTTKADCQVVKDDPCNPCSCGDKPIAVTQTSRFEADARAIECRRREPVVCGACRKNVPDCRDGKCVAVPE